jgi:hypothetical protein
MRRIQGTSDPNLGLARIKMKGAERKVVGRRDGIILGPKKTADYRRKVLITEKQTAFFA